MTPNNWHESETVEFKQSTAEMENAGKTLVSFANKEGGTIYFGVKDDGFIVGLSASDTTIKKLQQLFTDNTEPKLYPDIEIINKDGKDLIQVQIKKSRTPYHTFKRHAFIRVGTSDKQMSLKEHHERWLEFENETYDFSSSICQGLKIDDFDQIALEQLKILWSKKENNNEYLNFSSEDILKKLLLKRGDEFTFAALILCGKEEKLALLLPEAEIRFGWKSVASKLDFDYKKDWRKPFLNIFDDIWEAINSRNARFPVTQGFFEGDIWAFDQKSIREAILNAFAHRNYQERGSIFIEITNDYFCIKNPGKFLSGISTDNILDVQGKWRNRLLMETLGKIGLVERYGHGLDRIFRKTIEDGKGLPVISELKTNYIELKIPALVKDEKFVGFLTALVNRKQIQFDFVKDLLFLEEIRENKYSDDNVRKEKFLDLGIIEKIGIGRGTKYILSQALYGKIGMSGEYTRKKWLEKHEQLQTLWKFFQQHKRGRMTEFRDGLFQGKLNNTQILRLLKTLKEEDKIYFDGKQRSPAAYWKIKE